MLTPITLLLIFFIAFVEIRHRSVKKKICIYFFSILVFELAVNVGYAFKISSIEIQCADIMWIVLLLYCIRLCFVNGMKKRNYIELAIMLVTLTTSIVIEIFDPYLDAGFQFRTIMVFAKLLIAVFAYNSVLSHYRDEILDEISNKIIPLQKLIYAVVLIELVLENVFDSNIMTEAIVSIFGNAVDQVTWMEKRGGLYSIQGLCKEPSHFAILLLFISLYDIYLLKSRKEKNLFFALNCLLLLVSGSFSSIAFLGVLMIVFLLEAKGKKAIIAAVAAAMIAIPVVIIAAQQIPMLNYYYQRLVNLFAVLGNDSYSYSSEYVRMMSIISSFNMWIERPIWGIGLGNNVLTGGGLALLSSLGIVNTIALLCIYMKERTMSLSVIMVILASCVTMDIGAYYSAYMLLFFMIMQKRYDYTVDKRRELIAAMRRRLKFNIEGVKE